MTRPRCLGICLFYNDDDVVDDAITHLLDNNHDVVVWDHGSNDRTSDVIDKYQNHLRGRHFLPRSFDFYKLFEHVSKYVIDNYAPQYDWVSFPESDEFLEGPDRRKNYYEHVCDVFDSEFDWVQFDNMVFWFTDRDDKSEPSPRKRIRHYSLWPNCPPRIYAWRARCMNIREFNENPAEGEKYPVHFNTCHYQFRSDEQLRKRIAGRRGLTRGGTNFHFDFMSRNIDKLHIAAERLHFDNGIDELSKSPAIDWREIYGTYERLLEILRLEEATPTAD